MEELKLEGISKVYNKGIPAEVKALGNVNLSIEKGDMIAITGASGSGKSTLLHILGCLDNATEGHYFIDGKDVVNMNGNQFAELRNKKFGFVLQEFGLLLDDTSGYNVSFPLIFNRKIKHSKISEKVKKALDIMGLSDKINTKTKYLSGGQKQRVAIARAIVNQPDVILADEPTGALDSNTAEEIINIFKELNEQGKTVIIVTHDERIAEKCKKRVCIADGFLTFNS